MHICKKCKKEWAEDFAFCPFCGEKYVPEVEERDKLNADVERIKSIIPLLKSVLGSTLEEKADLLSKISEQQKVLDETTKELSEIKEMIKQNSLVPMNYPPQYGMPYPQYPAYVYPTCPPQGGVYPGGYPQGVNAPADPKKGSKNVDDALVINKDGSIADDLTASPESKSATRKMSILMILISLIGILIPCLLTIITVNDAKINGIQVIEGLFLNLTQADISSSVNEFAVYFNNVLSVGHLSTQIVWWLFLSSFVLALLCLFIDVIIGILRTIKGTTKGKFYYISFIALCLLGISVVGAVIVGKELLGVTGSILDIVEKTFRNVLEEGYGIFAGAIGARFVISFFVKGNKINKRRIRKQAKKEAKKAMKLAKQAR